MPPDAVLSSQEKASLWPHFQEKYQLWNVYMFVFNTMRPRVKKKAHVKADFRLNGCLSSSVVMYISVVLFLFVGVAECKVTTSSPCDKTREIFNDTWGYISDSPSGNYTQDSHCEWLIRAKDSRQFITLKFHSMETECSFDYIFVHDGHSFDAPLLGSFSGNTIPQPVFAQSGAMLILLYSDTNYALNGFQAEYSISDCPNNCTGHGTCVNYTCVCSDGYYGGDCSYKLCSENCGASESRGMCVDGRCMCAAGYSGESCSLNRSDPNGNNWHWLSHKEFGLSPRAAHTAIYVNETDSLYVFAGYNLNDVLGDLVVYNFNTSEWHNMTDSSNRTTIRHPRVHVHNPVAHSVEDDRRENASASSSRLKDILFTVTNNATVSIRMKALPERTNNHIRLKRSSETTKTFLKPSSRYGHAGSPYPGGFVIFGGRLPNGSLSNELWFYNVTSNLWTLRAVNSTVKPLKLTRHTVTVVENRWLYVFGGSTERGEFSSRMYRIELGFNEQWNEVKARGGRELDVRVVAHSTVYHRESYSLIVYGGVVADGARFSKLSDRMFAFDLKQRYWSEIFYPRTHFGGTFVPGERAFHTSTVVGNYLVVFGGYSHRHHKEEICYDSQIYFYHLGCHTWINDNILWPKNKAAHYPKQQGVFAHAADLRNGNTLLIVGGYHGSVNGDLLAYVLPPTLATSEGESNDPEQNCWRHRNLSECIANPECGWCSADKICYGRTVGTNCTTNLQTTQCPGVCPALADCHSCVIHGSGKQHSSKQPSATISVAQKLKRGQCTWCVQNARCHHVEDNFGVCGDTPSHVTGWWGSKGAEVVQVEKCRTMDNRPGFTFLTYDSPANFSQPDSVSINNATSGEFRYPQHSIGHGDMSSAGDYVARLLGFLHVPKMWEHSSESLIMCTSYSNAVLKLSSDSTMAGLLQVAVANHTSEVEPCVFAEKPSGIKVVLKPGSYLVDFESRKPLTSSPSITKASSKMQLQHVGEHGSKPEIFSFEYLEPYRNGSCSLYTNCLQCLADSLCGWCEINNKCFKRSENEKDVCTDGEEWHYLTLLPSGCSNCSNFITCTTCVQSNLCEWWTEDDRCTRKGRSPEAVTNVSVCPVPCYERETCSQCLGGEGRCVWCEATQECFLFSVYTSEYQFGVCREWLDQNYYSRPVSQQVAPPVLQPDQCKICDRHANCSSCLQTLGCGWCFSKENPTLGICVKGDFSKPFAGSCLSAVKENLTISVEDDEWDWAYAECPDVDECELGLHDCHSNAKCANTHGSYICQCNRGFIGDGKSVCNKTCFEECINGYCSGPPDFVCRCNLGWTGIDCATNCGCNNHSTCTKGIGICDECQDWSEGEFCERCRAGSYGNATSFQGCHVCNCNEHGNATAGVCDEHGGICFCQDNTEGDMCEKCKSGFYGDPRDGGMCYYQCTSRGLLTGLHGKGIGSGLCELSPWQLRLKRPPGRDCLWIISPYNTLQKSAKSQESVMPTVIQLTLHEEINITCPDNSVLVYDGLPEFVSQDSQHHVLGSFCSQDSMYPLTVQAKSGIMTIYFKQGEPPQGFNASYEVLSCPSECRNNRECKQSQCVCKHNWTGPECNIQVCPNNCTFDKHQGICDKDYGRCYCNPGFVGEDCSEILSDSQVIFTELFNTDKLSDSFDHLRKMLPRFGHTLVSDPRGSLWMFGGLSLSHGPLNDMRLFDTKNNTWMQVTIDTLQGPTMPQGRYFHAAETDHTRTIIYVFGGYTLIDNKKSVVLNDFWKFDLKDRRWLNITKLEKNPPPLAGHTLTLRHNINSESLIIIGGFSPAKGFLDTIWEYDLRTKAWSTLDVLGNKPLGVYGHSTVYHPNTESFYVFGGYMYKVNRTIISNELYMFHYPTRYWSQLPVSKNQNPPIYNLPRARFLHSAVTAEDYMLIFGGRTEPHNASDSLVAYVYSCNLWLRLIEKDIDIVGTPPPSTYAQAMTRDSETRSVYVIGGFDGGIQSYVTRINLPNDLCALRQSKERCRSFSGCSYCTVIGSNGENSSYCYSNRTSASESCSSINGSVKYSNGVECSREWMARRDCNQYSSCTECLAIWPSNEEQESVCTWCSSCQKGYCIPAGEKCPDENKCTLHPRETKIVTLCSELQCPASDCDKCLKAGHCVWTRHVLLTPELSLKLSSEPTYNWNCIDENVSEKTDLKMNLSPPSACPAHCNDHLDCRSCLESGGGEGGWHECHWSVRLNECISPSYQPLHCAGGVCGLVLKGSPEQCPVPCSTYQQCSLCLQHPNCGWCAQDKSNSTGKGVCVEGTLDKPHNTTCDAVLSKFANNTINAASRKEEEYSPTWHYIRCPPEDECLNNHHTCDNRSEQCVNEEDGFQCVCGKGYKLEKSICIPVCEKGCEKGVCVEPDKCECNFGYVGINCSIECHCNGHSNCAGPDELSTCLECHNNTVGPQCEKCKPLFVGDPTNNGKCVPCFEYCNGHTSICISETNDTSMLPDVLTGLSQQESENLLHEGPRTRAKCIGCANLTKGDKCEECIPGNFRGSEDRRQPCRQCECHGHGDTCDAVTGEKCNCQNNTESDPQCLASSSKNSNQQCWKLQCSKCKESYAGTPTNGHQCYRQMGENTEYCFDPETQVNCTMKPKPLHPGRSVFFFVQPRFTNVDIRIIIDVTQGGLNLFFSPKDDTFIVNVNKSNGVHMIDLDSNYKIHIGDMKTADGITLAPPPAKQDDHKATNSFSNDNFPLPAMLKPPYSILEKEAKGLTTFVTMNDPYMFLVVKNLQNRLVVTLPQDCHNLSTSRFYTVLHGVGSPLSDVTYGVLFFHQDQLHFDLFVFFSVFFSCFFLFLAVCVVAWKIKQAADVRRARRRHVVEMLYMAKRPVGKVTVISEPDSDEEVVDLSASSTPGTGDGGLTVQSPMRKKWKHHHRLAQGRESPKVQVEDKFDVHPIAIEPTDDGVAAVCTVFVHLPGGSEAPVKLGLASALVLMTRVYPQNGRAFLRRRSSHSGS